MKRMIWICRDSMLLCFLMVFSASLVAEERGSNLSPCGMFNVRDYGAKGDGRQLDTRPIQAAIDDCAKAGGTVLLPPGKYLCGSIFLRSNITLHLSGGTTLLGSSNIADYEEQVPQIRSWTDRWLKHSLIYGEGLENIAISGLGTIDGQGGEFKVTTKKKPDRYFNRPYLIRLVSCKNVLVEDVTLRNSAMWMQHYFACDGVTVRGIKVFNHCNTNNDMIDIDGSRNVIISDCFGDTDDDAITLKSTSNYIVENVAISNCVISSHVNALKIGTESHGGFRNINISNMVVKPSAVRTTIYGLPDGEGGITLSVVDGGFLDGVVINNVCIDGAYTPIFMRLGDRGRRYYSGQERPAPGSFRNVHISNVIASGAGDLGCSITGIPGHSIENVSLSHIRIEFAGGGTAEDLSLDLPELAEMYPDANRFGKRPAYGLYTRHVSGLSLDNITFCFVKKDVRPALVGDDVAALRIEAFCAGSLPETEALIRLRNARDVLIANSRSTGEADTFLLLEGAASKQVKLVGNDMHSAREIVKTGGNVDKSAVQLLGNFQE